MPYRLIHDSDLDDVGAAAAELRKAARTATPHDLFLLAQSVSEAIERMFDRNESACGLDEAHRAMIEFDRNGSHFSGKLADLYFSSDKDNRQRLRAAFARVLKEHS